MTDAKPTLTIIVAVANNNAIGRNGDLIVRLRDDMRHFRELTMGHPIIMGRKTWESLPKRPLSGRRNIVITHNPEYEAPGAEIYHSLEDALGALSPTEHAFIIGGASIYEEALKHADTIELTRIEVDAPDADTFFPNIDTSEWEYAESSPLMTDPDTAIKYRYCCLYRQ